MESFYSDIEKLFQCKIVIEGASIDDAIARLVLDFGNNFCYLFTGKIDKTGKCKIKVPALKHVLKEEGKVTLEVIADSMFFEPWESKFEVKKSKNVTVEFDNDDEDDIPEIKPKVKVIKEEAEILKEKIEVTPFRDFFKTFKNKKIETTSEYKKYSPSKEAIKILKESKRDVTGSFSKIFMYYLDKKVIK
jgi:hypothetical protein